jgi:hypothetical protein
MSAPTLSSAPDGIPRFEVQPASPELQDAVNQFWLMRLDAPAPHLVPRSFGTRMLVVLGADGLLDQNAPGFPAAYRHQLVVPDGSLDILVRLPYRVGEDAPGLPAGGTAYATVLMPVRHTIDIAFHIPSFIFIIRFFPGGARDFFPVGVHKLGDRAIPLQELWGITAVEFANDMAGANSITAMATVAERYLMAQRREPSEASMIVRRSVQLLEESRGNLPLDELQRDSGITERQLERLFMEYVGISP